MQWVPCILAPLHRGSYEIDASSAGPPYKLGCQQGLFLALAGLCYCVLMKEGMVNYTRESIKDVMACNNTCLIHVMNYEARGSIP